jgi:hypothetical protein
VLVLALGLPTLAHGQTTLDTLRALETPDPVLTYAIGSMAADVQPWDIAAVELSESGGITDVFLRLHPDASATLERMTAGGIGTMLEVQVCGHLFLEAPVTEANATGTLYLPDTNALRGEAVRALWQGRARCDTLGPEVFPDGH